MRERQKVPLGPSSDLAPVKSISVTPAHKLDVELFHSHDWAADIYPQSHRVMEPVCPSCTVILWPFTSRLPDQCRDQRRADITLDIFECMGCRC